jgi:hypothetical protein
MWIFTAEMFHCFYFPALLADGTRSHLEFECFVVCPHCSRTWNVVSLVLETREGRQSNSYVLWKVCWVWCILCCLLFLFGRLGQFLSQSLLCPDTRACVNDWDFCPGSSMSLSSFWIWHVCSIRVDVGSFEQRFRFVSKLGKAFRAFIKLAETVLSIPPLRWAE